MIFSLWLNLERREDFQSNFYHLDRSRNETGLLALQEEKESLKKNKANLEPKRYKEELADLNIRIRTAKKGLKKLDSLDEYIGKIISDFLNMILDSGGKVSQESKGRKYKYIHFHF